MLSDDKLKRELVNVLDFCGTISRRTEGRYSQELDKLIQLVRAVSVHVSKEVDLRRELELYRARGFKVDPILKTQYRTPEELISAATKTLAAVKDLNRIRIEFNEVESRVPDPIKNNFKVLVVDPEKLTEAKTMWGQIRSILERAK